MSGVAQAGSAYSTCFLAITAQPEFSTRHFVLPDPCGSTGPGKLPINTGKLPTKNGKLLIFGLHIGALQLIEYEKLWTMD